MLVGEIYNYQELNNLNLFFKHEVSDTEILANLFEKIPKIKLIQFLTECIATCFLINIKIHLQILADPNGEKIDYINMKIMKKL